MISVTRTDVGKLRVNNQDALIVLEQLYGVADGMGGHKGGEVASAGARDGLEKFLKGKTPDPRLLKTAVEAVNRRLYLRQREEAELSGMGTTLTVLWAGEREIYLAHVGDSRAYLLREGDLHPGDPGPFPGAGTGGPRRAYPGASRPSPHAQRDYPGRGHRRNRRSGHHYPGALQGGHVAFVLPTGSPAWCSDEEMAGILRTMRPEAAADRLLQAALDHGGRDNISFVILKDQEGAQ